MKRRNEDDEDLDIKQRFYIVKLIILRRGINSKCPCKSIFRSYDNFFRVSEYILQWSIKNRSIMATDMVAFSAGRVIDSRKGRREKKRKTDGF